MMKKNKITYCLWFDQGVEEAVKFYTGVFRTADQPRLFDNPVDTPSGKEGTLLTASFDLHGQEFLLLNGGSAFKLNPAVSFLIHCDTAEEVESLWNRLSDGGKALMPLDEYPFSDKYGWIEDKYGVSWQLILPKQEAPQKVMPSLLFVQDVCGKAEEAIGYYTAVFHTAKTGTVARYPSGMAPDREGTIMYADFLLEGQWFAAMDSAREHQFHFNEAVSFMVHCDTQEEVDYYWDRLGAGGKELQCGWLRDKYGVTWQVVPGVLLELTQGKDKERARRVMLAMMKMVKLDIAALENA